MTTAIEIRREKSIHRLCIAVGGFFGLFFYLIFVFILWINGVSLYNWLYFLLNFLCLGFLGGTVLDIIIMQILKDKQTRKALMQNETKF
jgi:hypothetical protein